MVLRRDGFGGERFYPVDSEISVLCTYIEKGHRYIIIRYLDLPFSYRLVNRDAICLMEEHVYQYLLPELESIDQGLYDDEGLAHEIKHLMSGHT